MFVGFPGGSAGKESTCNAGVLGSIPGLGKSPGEGKGYPLQCSGLENSMDYTVHGVTKSQTRLSSFHFHFDFSLSFIIPGHKLMSSSVSTQKVSSGFSLTFIMLFASPCESRLLRPWGTGQTSRAPRISGHTPFLI